MRLRMLLPIGLAACSLIWTNSAQAQVYFSTGTQLLEKCLAEPGSLAHIACTGEITGAVDQIRYENEVTGKCGIAVPDEVTRGELRDVVVKFLQDNPDMLPAPSAHLIVYAMIQAFPCPK
jgi:hypothetical protein